ncbi:MAG: hypothetical protein HYU56_01540 [Candidatus Aenigmarchaeota archaeon]|nr:hypothetical protein [Candidatus Aenigmarchaeota archaeon]
MSTEVDQDHAILAFDGLSLAGKSTFVQMLYERSENAVVIRENTFDPLRPATAKLNEMYRSGMLCFEGLDKLEEEYPQYLDAIKNARDYVERLDMDGPDLEKDRQAALAYMFAAGRTIVNEKLIKAVQKQDVILDRWQVTGWAYQSCPAKGCEDSPYRWEAIRRLNEHMGIWYPNLQIIVTCSLEQIPLRRAYRQKIGVGTAGQMSLSKEGVIYNAFIEIHDWLLGVGVPSIWIENSGTPSENPEEQIRQAIPHYLRLEGTLRDYIEAPITGGVDKYRLKPGRLSPTEAGDFFLQPEVLERIYQRQTSRK